MSSSEKTVQYTALDVGDKVQEGDQWLDEFGKWQSYVFLSGLNGVVGYGVRARRPTAATQPATYEEVPGSRTTQQAVDQPKPERIAYEELRPGDIIQEGDEWQHESGRWKPFASLDGSCVQVRHSQRTRRPHNITALQDERDKLRAEMDIVKGDRMNLREALAAEQRAHKVTMASGLQACKERDEACRERDKAQLAIAQVKAEFNNQAEVLAEVRADEKRLYDDLSRLRGEYLKVLVERDEARAEVQRLQEVVSNLYSEPTARQVQQMLRTWATELDWSAGCFDSAGREQIDTIQKTLVAVIERIEGMLNPEGGTDDE